METSDPLYREFLNELDALERFRMTYASIRPQAGLGGDDPDVRRMIEAMALFSARARQASHRSMDQGIRRMFQQHFSYLCDPMPGMAMLAGTPGGRMADAAHLPCGSRIVATQLEQGSGSAGSLSGVPTAASFCTTAGLRILPVILDAVDLYRRPGGGFRMVFAFESGFFRNDEIGELNLFVNYLDDVLSSLHVLDALKAHIQDSGAIFGETVLPESHGTPVEVGFGAPKRFGGDMFGLDHPLQRIRSLFHFPRQALYLNLRIDEQPRNWESFGIYIDLDDDFPTHLRLSSDTFCMHVTPVANLARSHGDAIEEDGTQDRQRVRHPDADARYVFHSIRGAYKIGEDALVPLTPGVLEDVDGSYEIELEGEGVLRGAYLKAQVHDAFESPIRLTVDAFWHQPALCDERLSQATVGPLDRTVEGAQWSLLGAVVPAADNLAVGERASLLQLLSIKNQRFLDLGNLLLLLRAVGAGTQHYFDVLLGALATVEVEAKPYGRGSRGFKYVYKLEYRSLQNSQLPALDLFSVTMLELLTVWSIEEVVELQVSVPNLEIARCYV